MEDLICLLATVRTLNGSQLAKMKKYIPHMSLHEIYREDAVGLKSSNYTLKI